LTWQLGGTDDLIMAKLKIITGVRRNQTFELSQKAGTLVIGRGPVDIVLQDRLVSRRHVKLSRVGKQWRLEDMGSANGTFLNESRISQAVKLCHNDQIRCGMTVLLFEAQEEAITSAERIDKPVDVEISAGDTISGFEFPGPQAGYIQSKLGDKIGEAIEKFSDESGLLEVVIDALLEHTPSACGFAMLKQPGTEKLHTVVEKDSLHSDNDAGVAIDSQLVETVLTEARALIVGDVGEHKRSSKPKTATKTKISSVLCAPIHTASEVSGVIYLGSAQKDAYNNAQGKSLTHIGMEVGLALENIRLTQAARQNERITAAGQTAVSLSHGIKNILQAVAGGAEVVDYAFKTGDIVRAKRGWNILKRNIERVRKLVLDMLQFSKESKPVFSNCRFNRLVESAVESLMPRINKKGIRIELNGDKAVGVVQVDADKIHDVILNLVLNAIDAVTGKTGVIKVSTKADRQNEQVILTVTDNGGGISDTEVIFRPFHSAKPKVGTGLGLAIAKKIVDLHDGNIKVQSRPGAGSTFIVTLPVKHVR